MISLKRLYSFSLIGWAMLFFGLGWVVLGQTINLQFGELLAVGLLSLVFGLGIVIATLKNIKSIDLEVEEV